MESSKEVTERLTLEELEECMHLTGGVTLGYKPQSTSAPK